MFIPFSHINCVFSRLLTSSPCSWLQHNSNPNFLISAYVAFSAAEYLLVGYNSFFYCLSYWEFPRCRLTLGVFDAPKKVRCATVPSTIVKLPLS